MIVDKGWNRIKANLKGLDRQRVEVGVFASQVGAHLVLIAAANHNGTRDKLGRVHIPRRPFILNAYRKRRKTLMGKRGVIASQLNLIYRKTGSSSYLLHALGKYMTEEVQDMIVKTITPHNAPSTIRQKGFDKPLIEDGTLAFEGIGYEVGRGR